jgi:hypothetical protein
VIFSIRGKLKGRHSAAVEPMVRRHQRFGFRLVIGHDESR